MRYIIPCILLALTTCLYADDPKSKAIRKYENEVEVLRKQGQAAIKRLEGVFEKEVEKLREKTLKDLQKGLDAALESKDLDKAVALRGAIKAFEGAEASGLAAKAEVASKKKIRKRIPKEAVSFGGHKYFYHDQPTATYRVALGIAESVGGHLVRIDSLKEFEFIMRMTGGQGMIDGTSEVGDGKWRFANGEELKLGNIRFRAGEPTNNNHKEYVLVLTPQGINDQAYERLPFIIEWD